jgi:hypothetical protein
MGMDETSSDGLLKEKISILLAEYNTLRAEVLAARGNVAQAVGIFAASILADCAFGGTIIITQGVTWWVVLPIFIGVSIVIYFVGLACWNDKNTQSFTRRLRQIEKQIYELTGEPLLIWETVYGWGGMFKKTNPNYEGFNPPERQWWPSKSEPPQSN